MARLLAPGAAYVGAYCGLLTLGWLDEKPGERLRLRYRPTRDRRRRRRHPRASC